jgi:hypothetical protein
MTTIDIELYGDIHVSGDLDLYVKRSFSLNSDINLDFFKDNKLILQTKFNKLKPYSRVNICFQDLHVPVSLAHKDKTWEWGGNWLSISHNWFYFISSKLCSISYNNKFLLNINRKNTTLSLKIDSLDDELLLNLVLFLIVHYSDIDGGE